MSFNRQKSKFVYELSTMYTLLAWCEPPRMDSVRNIPGQLFIFVCGGIMPPHIFSHFYYATRYYFEFLHIYYYYDKEHS